MKATLQLQASLRNGVTYLKQSYFSPPFKLANITEDRKGPDLHLMLMSASPGILDGDDYTIEIRVDAGGSLQLHTQAYQRLFNMKAGAMQAMKVVLGEGASFIYLPHPAVPHKDSVFTAANEIYMADGCSLIWGEILTCGRNLNGEIFQLSKYQNVTKIFLNARLVLKENLLIEPAFINPARTGQMAGYTHQASLIMLKGQINAARLKEQIAQLLQKEPDIDFGITTAPVSGILVRILGYKAEQLHRCLQSIVMLVKTEPAIAT